MQQLVDTLPLAALLKRQPRFVYKYLTSYAATSFSRSVRLATIYITASFWLPWYSPIFLPSWPSSPSFGKILWG
ncbi:MAG: hypothetical protein WKG07_10170 [Hymenobacter sp.]